MKKFIIGMAAAALLVAGLTTIQAQNIIGTNSFIGTLGNWIISADIDTVTIVNGVSVTNRINWDDTTFEVATGYKQVTGNSAASYLRLQKDFTTGWNIGVDAQFYGLGSAFNVIEAQGGYSIFQYYSLKLDGDLCAGFDNILSAAIIEPKLTAEKKITELSFTEISTSQPVESKGKFNGTPTIYIGGGFCIDRTKAQQGSGLLGLKKNLFGRSWLAL